MSDYNNGNQGRWTQGPGGQNQYPGGPGAPDPMRQDQPRPRNGYATVSMICGIFGDPLPLLLCLSPGHHPGRGLPSALPSISKPGGSPFTPPPSLASS